MGSQIPSLTLSQILITVDKVADYVYMLTGVEQMWLLKTVTLVNHRSIQSKIKSHNSIG